MGGEIRPICIITMKKLFIKYEEIIVYVFFGVLATIVSWGSYAIFERYIHLSVMLSSVLSWIIAMLFAFFTNKVWVFKSKSFEIKLVTKEFFAFAASRGVTGVIEVFGVPLLERAGFDSIFIKLVYSLHLDSIDVLLTRGLYSKIVLSVIVVVLNYVFSKLIVFRKDKKSDSNEQ